MEKIKEIDYLRGITTIFVLLIHLTSSYLNYPKESFTYQFFGSFNCALTFAVPAFLFISALIMTYQLKHKEDINWVSFIFKRVFKVLLALILWSIIYTLYWGNFNNVTIKTVIDALTLGNASYHLYFIPLIIQLYLIFPLIWFTVKFLSKIKLPTSLSFISCLIIGILFHSAFTLIFRLDIFKNFPYFAIVIFSYSFPIILGIWLGFNYEKIKNYYNKVFLVCLMTLTILTGYYYIEVQFVNYIYKDSLLFSPLYWNLIILTLFYLLRYIKKSTFLTEISKKSFIIYLSHPLVLDIVSKKLSTYNLTFPGGAFINYSINLAISFIIILVITYLLSFIYYYIKNAVKTHKI